ncbi:PREDICTED: cathepsin O-like isoform X2 [Priapulus caudatus]|uniref:Cathepsin O-like isoform X2 n=1 Tax=Priapulus caudatus TaxID=37621 RepID=A0ABM1ERF4_PRICU|nr:PREDICTED: cathepsin O-like isoform X2 [Priapulus caudatus]
MAAPTKYLFLHVLFCVVVILLYTYVSANTNRKIEQLFKQYIAKYNKTHVEGSKEYIFRMNVFEKSLIRHAKLNSKTVSIENAQFGINKFSDMTPEEFQVKFLKLKQEPAEPFQPLSLDLWLGNKPIATTERTQKVDWRKTNKVTAVNNQKDCGACWAFSSVEIIESMVAIRKGVLAPLSVQQMTDCARFGNRGCQGGNIETALMWLKSTNTALVSSKKYPLTWKTETCKLTNSTEGVTISSHATYGKRSILYSQKLMGHGFWTQRLSLHKNWQECLRYCYISKHS